MISASPVQDEDNMYAGMQYEENRGDFYRKKIWKSG